MIDAVAVHANCQPWQVCMIGDSVTDFDMSLNATASFVRFASHAGSGIPDGTLAVQDWNELQDLLGGTFDENSL